MELKTIILSGVHGVGKGHWIREVYSEKDDFICLTASELIREFKSANDAGYKKVIDVKSNQELLLAAIKSKQDITRKNILLDGHICIVNSKNKVEKIPLEFFIEAKVCGVLILEDAADKIYERLDQRDNNSLGIEMIKKIQMCEREYADLLNKNIEIKVRHITHKYSREQLLDFVRECWFDGNK